MKKEEYIRLDLTGKFIVTNIYCCCWHSWRHLITCVLFDLFAHHCSKLIVKLKGLS